ncbi:MAG: iron-siderophore ABC transporter substrate-binding protein [Rhodoferax sp.]|uniref:iron-siderophore ABC transporter substrate-binding protein n=1 Tax=Rhodoferax sp. TaxID=50421 RepID=UPI0032671EFE
MLFSRCRPRMVAWFLCVACGLASAAKVATPPATPSGPAAPRTLAANLGSGTVDGVFPRTVAHYLGTTKLAKPPLRVAVLSTGQNDGLLTLGLVPVGTTRDDQGRLYADYLAQTFAPRQAEMRNTADLGVRSAPDLEVLATLKPDLILVNKTLLSPQTYALYQRIAPTVVTRGNGINWKIDFLLVADALGRRDQAQTWLKQYHADATALAKQWPKPAPTVSFVQTNAQRNRIMGLGSFTGSIAEDAGLQRPASQRFAGNSQDISNELLDLADADWIFYAGRDKSLPGLTGSPLWKSLRGVAQNHAQRVELDPFYLNAGPLAARTVLAALARTSPAAPQTAP